MWGKTHTYKTLIAPFVGTSFQTHVARPLYLPMVSWNTLAMGISGILKKIM